MPIISHNEAVYQVFTDMEKLRHKEVENLDCTAGKSSCTPQVGRLEGLTEMAGNKTHGASGEVKVLSDPVSLHPSSGYHGTVRK